MIAQKTIQCQFSNRTVDIGKKIREEEEAWNGPHGHGRLFDVQVGVVIDSAIGKQMSKRRKTNRNEFYFLGKYSDCFSHFGSIQS